MAKSEGLLGAGSFDVVREYYADNRIEECYGHLEGDWQGF